MNVPTGVYFPSISRAVPLRTTTATAAAGQLFGERASGHAPKGVYVTMTQALYDAPSFENLASRTPEASRLLKHNISSARLQPPVV